MRKLFPLALCALTMTVMINAQTGGPVYELRTYTTNEGKLPDLLKRFREHTMEIFERHHMANVGYWVPADEPLKSNTLIYIISHPSREAAVANWKAFGADPEWKSVAKASEENGKIVTHVDSKFMTPTDFSRITKGQTAPRIYELRTYTCNEGKLPDLLKRFREHTMDIFERHHMANVGYWIPADEPLKSNTLVYIISHPSREAAAENWKAFRADPEWQKVSKASDENGKIVNHTDSKFMTPTDFSPLK